MKKIIGLLTIVVGSTAMAATVTVPGDAATINAALEMLDYNDGEDDLVLVGPGVYDEQVFPKGNAGVDSSAFPVVSNLTLQAIEDCLASHTDRLEIRGSDLNSPPVLRIESASPESYGFFPEELDKYFHSTLVMGAQDVTFSNIEIRSNPDHYTINGMASNWVWQDCVFSNGSGNIGPGEDFCDYQNNRALNSDNNPDIGLDNEYIYSNCIIDGDDLLDGSGGRFDSAFVWWHGYGGDTPVGEAVGSGVLVDNCVVRNWGDDILFNFNSNAMGGTRGGLGPVTVRDCYFSASQDLFSFRGACEDTVFIRNVIDGAQSAGNDGGFAVRIRERMSSLGARGFTEDLVVANNLFVGAENFTQVYLGLHESVTADEPDLFVVNNTFYDYEVSQGVVFVTGPSGGNLSIANNIFMADETGIVGRAVNIENVAANVTVENNLFWNNANDVTGATNVEVVDSVMGDPDFNGTTVNLPTGPPVFLVDRLQEFVPNPSSPAVSAGKDSAYNAVASKAGEVDLDTIHPRIGGAGIDIGAQESDSHFDCFECPFQNCLLCDMVTETPTPTATGTATPTLTATPSFTPTFSPTSTPEPTVTSSFTPTSTPAPMITSTFTSTPTSTPQISPSNTPDPSDINGDGAIDAKDLMMLLLDWKKANGP